MDRFDYSEDFAMVWDDFEGAGDVTAANVAGTLGSHDSFRTAIAEASVATGQKYSVAIVLRTNHADRLGSGEFV